MEVLVKKTLIIILLSFVLLIGCEKEVAIPSVNTQLPVYTTFEIGPNFTNHIWALSADQKAYKNKFSKVLNGKIYDQLPSWYTFAFTHEADYLWPQIFYYVPLGFDFNSKESWEEYFSSWREGIETQAYNKVANYLNESHLKVYIKDVFENTSKENWETLYINQLDLLEELSAIYLKTFDDYVEEIWPEISFDLKNKTLRINESVSQKDLINQWADETQLQPNQLQYKFSLTYISHDTFDYVQTQPNVFVCPYDLYEEGYKYLEFMSHRIGYRILTQNQNAFLHDIYESYGPMMPDYNVFKEVNEIIEFTTAQYNHKILGYETEIYKDMLDDVSLLEGLKWKYDPLDSGEKILEEQIHEYLTLLKDMKPYKIGHEIYYENTLYEIIYSEEEWSLYYGEGLPLITEAKDGLNFITENSTSKPVLSFDESKIAYISPWPGNALGEIYLIDLKTKEIQEVKINTSESNQTIKSLAFDDQGGLYLIKGPAFPSYSLGGALYKLDIKTGDLTFIEVPLKAKEEIVSIHLDSSHLYVKVVTYNPTLQVESERRVVIKKISF